jgi:hypothetical protein
MCSRLSSPCPLVAPTCCPGPCQLTELQITEITGDSLPYTAQVRFNAPCGGCLEITFAGSVTLVGGGDNTATVGVQVQFSNVLLPGDIYGPSVDAAPITTLSFYVPTAALTATLVQPINPGTYTALVTVFHAPPEGSEEATPDLSLRGVLTVRTSKQ